MKGTESYHPFAVYDDNVLEPLLDGYGYERGKINNDNTLCPSERDSKEKQLNQTFIKAYKEVLVLYNCSLHQEIKNIVDEANKSQCNGKRQKIVDGIKEVEKKMDTVTYYQDEDTIVNLGKELSNKLDELKKTAGTTELGMQIAQLKQNIQGYFNYYYVYEAIKAGNDPDPLMYSKIKN